MKSKKNYGLIAAFLLTVTGTYNAVVINSQSEMESQDHKFVKRLDEVYGVVTPGRKIAAVTSTNWQKLSKPQVQQAAIVVPTTVVTANEAAPAQIQAASIKDELNLNLVEVVNVRKWQHGLGASQFSGNLNTNNGTIESLSVSLPSGLGVSVSFSEMSGNVFEFDMDGELCTGMLYQVDPGSYMVTLTSGPLEGTRLRFSQGEPLEVAQPSPELLEQDAQVQAESIAQGGQDLNGASFQF